MNTRSEKRRHWFGNVISDKMEKTVVVAVARFLDILSIIKYCDV